MCKRWASCSTSLNPITQKQLDIGNWREKNIYIFWFNIKLRDECVSNKVLLLLNVNLFTTVSTPDSSPHSLPEKAIHLSTICSFMCKTLVTNLTQLFDQLHWSTAGSGNLHCCLNSFLFQVTRLLCWIKQSLSAQVQYSLKNAKNKTKRKVEFVLAQSVSLSGMCCVLMAHVRGQGTSCQELVLLLFPLHRFNNRKD